MITSDRGLMGLSAGVIVECVAQLGPLWHGRHQAELASRPAEACCGRARSTGWCSSTGSWPRSCTFAMPPRTTCSPAGSLSASPHPFGHRGLLADVESDDHGLGRSRGGLTTKLPCAVEHGRAPLFTPVTAGQRHGGPRSQPVLDGIRMPRTGPGRPEQAG
ncbi:hypothetical protein GCM10010259_55610 [Streptomyces daghestanicus]|uniref:Uncharacterized protein n=1 Tax=Streptomyces daghestanicus TaxID=66885 RepID=A0ABQ3QE37_9ACTN|nr:hypothetical protein GCM10010259_55610 [Streptomyces daghestanicus]GHI35537.1 hypothetical protein Sdagh_72670 [Streptomyces daghestanicus]